MPNLLFTCDVSSEPVNFLCLSLRAEARRRQEIFVYRLMGSTTSTILYHKNMHFKKLFACIS